VAVLVEDVEEEEEEEEATGTIIMVAVTTPVAIPMGMQPKV
jgi:hypothetical protein